jgi:hypothetical protein
LLILVKEKKMGNSCSSYCLRRLSTMTEAIIMAMTMTAAVIMKMSIDGASTAGGIDGLAVDGADGDGALADGAMDAAGAAVTPIAVSAKDSQ